MDAGLEAGPMPDADASQEVNQEQIACEVPLFDAQNPCFHDANELMAATPVADYVTDFCYPYVRIRMSSPGGNITCLYGGNVTLAAWERWSLTAPIYCNGKGWGIFAPVQNLPAGSISGCLQFDGATVIGTDGNPLPDLPN